MIGNRLLDCEVQTEGRTDGCMGGRPDVGTDGRTDGQTEVRKDGRTSKCRGGRAILISVLFLRYELEF